MWKGHGEPRVGVACENRCEDCEGRVRSCKGQGDTKDQGWQGNEKERRVVSEGNGNTKRTLTCVVGMLYGPGPANHLYTTLEEDGESQREWTC